jgi:hypothetical protein
MGKTILWERGVEEAKRSLGRVLTCRGVEAEASLSFAGLSDLLGEALGEAMPSLAAPRRRALEVALLLAEPGDQPRMRTQSDWRCSMRCVCWPRRGQW